MLRLKLHKAQIAKEDAIPDFDEEPLSEVEAATLGHAQQLSHMTSTYPRSCWSSTAATPTPTSSRSIERILSENYTTAPEEGPMATPRRHSGYNFMKRLSRLGASTVGKHAVAAAASASPSSPSSAPATTPGLDDEPPASSSPSSSAVAAPATSLSAGAGSPCNSTTSTKQKAKRRTITARKTAAVSSKDNATAFETMSNYTTVQKKKQQKDQLSPLITDGNKALSQTGGNLSDGYKSSSSSPSKSLPVSSFSPPHKLESQGRTNTGTSFGSGTGSAGGTLSSPASSMIFERSVQDIYPEGSDTSSSHYHNEDYIPPVLEASTHAITNAKLDPELVDVVSLKCHNNHCTPNRHHSNRSMSMSDSLSGSPTSPFDSPKIRGRSTTDSSLILPPSIGLGMSTSNTNFASPSSSSSPTPPPAPAQSSVRPVLSFYSFADIVSSENLPQTAATSPGKLSPASNRSMSPSRLQPQPPGSPAIEDEVTVTSMGETLRQNTVMSQGA